jgi:hypothetical protein
MTEYQDPISHRGGVCVFDICISIDVVKGADTGYISVVLTRSFF